MTRPLILGLSASLRNARTKAGSKNLLEEITRIRSREELDVYIADQAQVHLDQFVAAGRGEGRPFDELYRELQRTGGLRGLSNSEVCLAAALWAARDKGVDIDHIPLSEHFPADGQPRDIDGLKTRLRAASGILLATPVYFGDRSSIAQRFIEMIRSDPPLRADLAGKVYAGVAVGAKRNGGQETTLIYQMLDMINLGWLGVGNDSDTTSQYGGTAHAGDIGTAPKDEYGINTCLGTGRRMARVSRLLATAEGIELKDAPRFGIWVMQDTNGTARRLAERHFAALGEAAEVQTINLVDSNIRPCLACDICPIRVGPDDEYRCIIGRRVDGMKVLHEALLWPDVLVPTVYSPTDREGLVSVYQEFMERTRYLRRGDYVYTDRLVVPLVFAELNAAEHFDVRLMTSFIRHHTVMHKPVIGWLQDGQLLNADEVSAGIAAALIQGKRLVEGRLGASNLGDQATAYNPVGYVLSQAKDNEAVTMSARELATSKRAAKLREESRQRLKTIVDTVASGE